jgi:hypothetical protein
VSAAPATGTTGGDVLLDLAPFGYEFLADRPARQNPPETQWLTNGLNDVVAGVMWEEHRPVRRIEFAFAGDAPDPSQLVLEVTTNTPTSGQDNRPTWWTRAWEPLPGAAARSADGRQIVYRTDREAIVQRLKQYPQNFRHEADPLGLLIVDKIRLRYRGAGKPPAVAALRAFGVSRLTPLRVAIQWGWRPGGKDGPREGRLDVYNGRLGRVEPLAGDVKMTGPGQGQSPAQEDRRGIDAEILYVADDAQEVKFQMNDSFPTGSNGLMTFHPNRTVVTVRTAGGSFSFAPKDLECGEPILVPSLGFFVAKSGSGQSPQQYAEQLAGKKLSTVRQRVRQMPEQSIARALADQYTAKRPAYPQPPEEPPMKIDVPDEFASSAWRLAFWQVKRRCVKQGDTYLFHIFPYECLLGQESWRIFFALDLLGEHGMTRSGFDPWFQSQGRLVARGMFVGKEGALNVSGWDLNHGQGHGSMLYAMAQHYLLSGDKAWLAGHLPNFCAAAEWIVRQRKQWLEKVGPDAWSAGLIPPCELGDYADWRSLYQTNVFYWRGLHSAARAIADVDQAAAARFLDEAEQYRRAIVKAVDRSVVLSPVVRVSDGTYRRYIPPQPYLRGLNGPGQGSDPPPGPHRHGAVGGGLLSFCCGKD